MTLQEIKTIAETWFNWPRGDKCNITYSSAIMFARDMYERGQQSERKRLSEVDEEPVAWITHNGFRFNADIEPAGDEQEVPLYLRPQRQKCHDARNFGQMEV